MVEKADIEKLASLSRISLTPDEISQYQGEIGAILEYVESIRHLTATDKLDNEVRDAVLREDGNPHESGVFTEAILSQAPQREGDYLVVKKIL